MYDFRGTPRSLERDQSALVLGVEEPEQRECLKHSISLVTVAWFYQNFILSIQAAQTSMTSMQRCRCSVTMTSHPVVQRCAVEVRVCWRET